MKKSKLAFVAVMACALAASLAILSGCAGKSAIGQWHFESMAPAASAMEGLTDDEKADREAEATMLSVFMSDAQVEFAENGDFTFTFLGDPYHGTWVKEGNAFRVTMGDDDYSSASGLYEVRDGKLTFTADEGAGRLAGFDVVYAEGAVETATPDNAYVVESDAAAAPEADASADGAQAVGDTAASDEPAEGGVAESIGEAASEMAEAAATDGAEAADAAASGEAADAQ